MPNKVRDWMSSPVIVVDADTSVSYALTLMRRRNIHSLIVAISGKDPSYGIITSTDIMEKILAADRNPTETRVSEIMTHPVLTAHPDWSLRQCSSKMHEHKIHHMPVMDGGGTIVGLISATDLFIAAEEIGWDAQH